MNWNRIIFDLLIVGFFIFTAADGSLFKILNDVFTKPKLTISTT